MANEHKWLVGRARGSSNWVEASGGQTGLLIPVSSWLIDSELKTFKAPKLLDFAPLKPHWTHEEIALKPSSQSKSSLLSPNQLDIPAKAFLAIKSATRRLRAPRRCRHSSPSLNASREPRAKPQNIFVMHLPWCQSFPLLPKSAVSRAKKKEEKRRLMDLLSNSEWNIQIDDS